MRGLAPITLFAVVSTLALSGEDKEASAYRRVIFDFEVPLSDEAPGVATDGNVAVFSAGPRIEICSARTGAKLASRVVRPPPGFQEDVTLHVLGICDSRIFASAYYFLDPDRPDPRGNEARIGGGPEPGHYEILSVGVTDETQVSLFRLPGTAYIAEQLLGSQLVYAMGERLVVRPLTEGGAEQTFDLKDKPQRRPLVQNGEVFGIGQTSVYFWKPGDKAIGRIGYGDSPLAVLAGGEGHAEKNGDSIVVGSGEVFACDLSGKLRWKTGPAGRLATGETGEICVLFGRLVYALAREDGRVLWCRAVPPILFDDHRIRGFFVQDGRVLVIGEKGVVALSAETGAILFCYSHTRALQRRMHHIHASLLKAGFAPSFAIVGFENAVYGVDLTATADVPEAEWANDIANPEAQIRALAAQGGGLPSGNALLDLGGKLAAMPRIPDSIIARAKAEIAKGNPHVLAAFHWLNDPDIPRALMSRIQSGTKPYDSRLDLLPLLACHSERSLVQALLRQIVDDPQSYSVLMRESAAQYLRLMSQGMASLSEDELKLLYSGDRERSISLFRKRLNDNDPAGLEQTLRLLGLAPDAVIAGLSDDVNRLTDKVLRLRALEMVNQARARLALISETNP